MWLHCGFIWLPLENWLNRKRVMSLELRLCSSFMGRFFVLSEVKIVNVKCFTFSSQRCNMIKVGTDKARRFNFDLGYFTKYSSLKLYLQAFFPKPLSRSNCLIICVTPGQTLSADEDSEMLLKALK